MRDPCLHADLSTSDLRKQVLAGISEGRPRCGPLSVHVDVVNRCNARCISCWDHSPLLSEPRSTAWKRQTLSVERFSTLVEDLADLGSVRDVVLSGMGEPLLHPDIYELIGLVKEQGWHLTLISNLVAADINRLTNCGIDQLLASIHGATPATYTEFHPGWSEQHFFTLCSNLRALSRAGVRTRHVHVITRQTAPELLKMVRFGRRFRADRVNFKLASLVAGTEACRITEQQLSWLIEEAVPEARALAEQQGVHTNLDLLEQQLQAAAGAEAATTPMAQVGCYMGYVYSRVTVDGEVLYCCDPSISVGHLSEERFGSLWQGERWQATREQLAEGRYFPGCERCGKFEQNLKWSERVRQAGAHQ